MKKLLIFALALFFNRTLYGRALRATAVNRVGARLAGISPTFAGTLTFTLSGKAGPIIAPSPLPCPTACLTFALSHKHDPGIWPKVVCMSALLRKA